MRDLCGRFQSRGAKLIRGKGSGWGHEADGTLCYKVTDFDRDLALKVTVTGMAEDGSDDDGTYETEPEEGIEEKDAE